MKFSSLMTNRTTYPHRSVTVLLLTLGLSHGHAYAQAPLAGSSDDFAAFAQATYVTQLKPGFRSPYSGSNSLSGDRETSNSTTITAYFGWRPWANGEVFFNPEAARGVPLSRLSGLGGLTNGELARTSGPDWTLYRARLFYRHTVAMGGETQKQDAEANQMAGALNTRRWVMTIGNLSALDVFDDNSLSKDPRTDFLNWSLMTYGAWDYPADARGYSWGAVLEYYDGPTLIRAGRFMMPRESNGLTLNRRIFQSYGDQIEVERAYVMGAQPGKARLLLFRTTAAMGSYADATATTGATGSGVGGGGGGGAGTGGTPDLAATRTERAKIGIGISFEQRLTSSLGLFGRASWNDGKSETFAFTEIDRSISAGLIVDGGYWGRGTDRAGLAFALNSLSKPHRDYLAAGGLGFFLGDGRLSYRQEQLAEAFYRWQPSKNIGLSGNLQYLRNPGYNSDRGPVRVLGLRLHAEY